MTHKIDVTYSVAIIHDLSVTRDFIAQVLKKSSEVSNLLSFQNLNDLTHHIQKETVDLVIASVKVIDQLIQKLPEIKKYTGSHIKVIVAIDKDNSSEAFTALKAISNGANDYVEIPSIMSTSMPVKIEATKAIESKVIEQLSVIYKEKHPEEFKLNTIKSNKNIPISKRKLIIQDFDANPSNLPITLRNSKIYKPQAIAIAASTGGPQALNKLFIDLKGEKIEQPIFITQHIPQNFSNYFAVNLSAVTGRECIEAKDKMPVENGKVYVAPGDHHMIVLLENGNKVLRLDQSAPINFCRPSADPMIETLSDIYGAELLVIILTGMGSDGLEGARYAAKNGAIIVAQDQASSVVWGMPGAVANNGLCNAVIPLDQIPSYIQMIGAS
ncbi:MAG: chemotaxis protein CheB [Alphaproteobacteria bacterium]|nr:chemotaxis protein CheB [Alphaproteobacteria bacterium]OJV15092.1 MAG: hypothetical protein BGO27_06610 [Alphaproteobacteria bacterium 33-17]